MAKLSIGKASSTVFSIKMSIPENLWANGRVAGKSQTAVSINHELDTLRGNAGIHYRELSAVREKVTAEDVKYHLQGMKQGQETLLSYFRTHNENFDRRVGINRAKGTAESDLNVLRDNWCELSGRVFFADKAYQDRAMQQAMAERETELLSPVKYPRGVPEVLKQMGKAADDLFSRAVSSVRQPIELLFAWLLEKTDIQRASKVRSAKGLIVHIFSKLAAIFMKKLVFNS